MRRTLRVTFFRWVTIQTLLVFLGIGIVVIAFNVKEMHEHADMAMEEAEETLVVAMVMLALLPVAVGSAWWITRRLLRPLQEVVATAERIGAGHFDERIGITDPDDEISRMGRALDGAFDRYQDTLERLERVSAGVAHQLRNPLAAIRTTGEIALRSPRDTHGYEEAIGSMLEDASRLNRTVEQLLLLAGCAREALDPQREVFSLTDLAKDVLDEAALVAESRSISLEPTLPPGTLRVLGVRNLIGEALGNLLDNALKFTPEGGRVALAIAADAGPAARISVTDSGPGVPPEQRSILFQPYQRAHDRRNDGVGLGLVIVADIVRAHGGSWGMEGADGGGSTFWFRIPLLREGSRAQRL